MDWELIISGVIGLLAGGSASWLFKIREDKAGAKADVTDKTAAAMSNMMEFITTQQERFNGIIAQKDTMIDQQAQLLDEYKCSLDEANRKIKLFEIVAKENERKLNGMQKTIDNEISKKKFAESNICFVEDCDLRQPAKGTYGKEN